jgi:lipopolysaccharide transport system permease protein
MIIKTYTSKSTLREPISMVKSMLSDFKLSFGLARYLLIRDINAKYRQTYLGYFWALIPPIIVAYGFVFAAKAKVVNLGATDIPYPAYIMLSMILWQTFLDAFNGPLAAVCESKVMLAKVNFPRESIVLAKVGEVFFNFLIKLVLVVLVFYMYEVPFTKMALCAPLGLIGLVILGTFLGLLIAPIGAIYQDVSKVVLIIANPWFLITPVLYSVPKDGFFSVIVKLNPVTPLLVSTRELATSGVVSDLSSFFWVFSCSVLGLIATWIIFRLAIPYVIERMPS